MLAKRFMLMALSLILVLGLVPVSCAKSATTPTPTTEVWPPALQLVIEGAKAEGSVIMAIPAGFSTDAIARLRSEIKAKFGVDLDIQYIAAGSVVPYVAKAIMEYQSGKISSIDLLTGSPRQFVDGVKAGIFDTVYWKDLLTKGMNPDALIDYPIPSLAFTSYFSVLMYNPQKVSAAEVPKTLMDLANPKWAGKVGIISYSTLWAGVAFITPQGKDYVFSSLRAILKNGAFQGTSADMYSRFLLGEIWMAGMGTLYVQTARDAGVPADFTYIDVAHVVEQVPTILKAAKHPNAAKLVALYLCSPEGVKFNLEVNAISNMYYPGNLEYDTMAQAKKQGVPVVFNQRDPKVIAFYASADYTNWQNELTLIFQGK
jgi:ABC-type Fe3+ transport system substrate-binding protein